MKIEKGHWFRFALQIKGSVVPKIYKRVISIGLFGVIISILYYNKLPVSQPIFAGIVPSIILSLLLVFRTNSAYERFWEGRKLWGSLVNVSRNLTRGIWITVKEQSPDDRVEKEAILRQVIAFAFALKLHLRAEPVNNELAPLLSEIQYSKLKNINHPSLEIAFWIGDYLQHQHERGCLNIYQLTALHQLVDKLIDILGGCERILKTPLPIAYTIHLKQLLLIYCLSLPFQLVKGAGLWTGAIVALISFTLFGIEEIGIEIENPFGYDANDLSLNTICNTIKGNIEDFMTWNSSGEYSNEKF
ncbi:hypothetical protein HW132_09320 [Brasilonema sp. CT11]|nr:hypothetical protein [Brasilonema sp. CT11]